MTKYGVFISGGWSVGLCLGANFAEARSEVSLLVREASLAGLRNRPIHVSALLRDHVIRTGQVEISDAPAPDDRIVGSDMLIVTTKAYDVADALRPFAGQGDRPALLMLQGLEAGRKTEIDFLNGGIVRLAEGEGLTATRHESVGALVPAREAARAS